MKLITLLILLLIDFVPARSVGIATPLIISLDGDLWAWSDSVKSFKQLTHWGGNRSVVLSPDGRYIAYRSIPAEVMADLKKNGGYGGGTIPYNIWILNLKTMEAIQAADSDESFITATLRSEPVWSADSRSIAWTEVSGGNMIHGGNYSESLITFNLEQRKQHIVVPDIPEFTFGGVGFPTTVVWSDYGFATVSGYSEGDSGNPQTSIHIYSPMGTLVSRTPISGNANPALAWIKHKNQWYVRVGMTDGSLSFLIDPDQHNQLPLSALTGKLIRCNTKAIDGICVYPKSDSSRWMLNIPGKDDVPLGVDQIRDIAIAPDGERIAVLDKQGCLSIFQNGRISPIVISSDKMANDGCPRNNFLIHDMTWGVQVWIVR